MQLSEKTIEFISENKKHNSTEWYRAHRESLLKYVQEPLADFINVLLGKLIEYDPYLDCDPRVGKGISRLYRDTRFSYDKSLFRDSLWFCVMREKSLFHDWPAFYFELSPRGYTYGCGYYQEDRRTADSVRKLIIEEDPLWLNAIKTYKKQKQFSLYSEKYKRSVYPSGSEDQQDWIDRKSLGLGSGLLPVSDMFEEGFYDKIADDFIKIMPVYKLMLEGALTAEKGD